MSYKIYTSNIIKENHVSFVNQCKFAKKRIEELLDVQDGTWDYDKYNLFCVTSMSVLFWNLYKELNVHIRNYIGDDRPLWLCSWLNFHSYEDAIKKLPYHSHQASYHGYISIDPQDTVTEFKKGFKIKNKIGQIYLGPGGDENVDYHHRVINNSYYSKPRITIGFNVGDINDFISHPIFIPVL